MSLLESAHDAIADIDLEKAVGVIEEGLAEAIAFGVDANEWKTHRLSVVRLMRLQQARLVQLKHAIRRNAL